MIVFNLILNETILSGSGELPVRFALQSVVFGVHFSVTKASWDISGSTPAELCFNHTIGWNDITRENVHEACNYNLCRIDRASIRFLPDKAVDEAKTISITGRAIKIMES